MKKLLFSAVALAAVLSLSSCSNDSEGSAVLTTPILAYNLYTPLGQDGQVSVSPVRYSFITTYPEATITVSTDNMSIPNGTIGSFTTVPMSYTTKSVEMDDKYSREILTFSNADPHNIGAEITNLSCVLTQAVYSFDDITVPGYSRLVPGRTLHYVVMQYDLNKTWRVRTFWPDMTFVGSTYMGDAVASAPDENKDMAYRVIMAQEKGALSGKADVILYNASFEKDAAPVEVMVLKNLEVKFDVNGYVVSGNNITVQTVQKIDDKDSLVDNPGYKFNKFSLRCSGNMTGATADYELNGTLKGNFTGTSALLQ